MNLYDVYMNRIGSKKINLIKAVRYLTGLGLKEAKDLVESAEPEGGKAVLVIADLDGDVADLVVKYLENESPGLSAWIKVKVVDSLTNRHINSLIQCWLTAVKPNTVTVSKQPKAELLRKLDALNTLKVSGLLGELSMPLDYEAEQKLYARHTELMLQVALQIIEDMAEKPVLSVPEIPF